MTKFDAITDGDDSFEHAKNDGTKAADHHGIEAGKHGDDHPASKWAEIAVASCKSSVGAAGDGACSVPGGHLPDLSLSQKESSGDDGKAAAGRKSSSSGDEALARSSVGTEHSLAAFSALAEAPAKDADKIKPAETSTSQPAMVSAPEVAARGEATRPTPAQPDNLSQQERSRSASDVGSVDSKKQASVNQVVRDFSGMVDVQNRRVDVAGLADKGPRESRTSLADSFNAVAEKTVASSENGTATISGGNNSLNTALASAEVAAKASAKPLTAVDIAGQTPTPGQLLGSFSAVVDKSGTVIERATTTGNLAVASDKVSPVSAVVKPTEIVQTELSVTPSNKVISAALARSDAGAVVGSTSGNSASTLGAGDASRFVRQPSQQSADGAVPILRMPVEPVRNGSVNLSVSAGSGEGRSDAARTTDRISPVVEMDNSVKTPAAGQLLSSFAAVTEKVVPAADRPVITANPGVTTDKSAPVSAVVKPTEIVQTELSVVPTAKPISAVLTRSDAGAVLVNPSVNGASSLGAGDASRFVRQPSQQSVDGLVPVVKAAEPVVNGAPGPVGSVVSIESRSSSVRTIDANSSAAAVDYTVKVPTSNQLLGSFAAVVDKTVPVGDRPTATGNLGVAIDKNSPVSAVGRPTEIAQTELSVTPNTKPGAVPVRTDAGAVVGNTSGNGASSLGAADTSRYARQPVASSTDGAVAIVKVAQLESQSPVVAPGTSASDKPVKPSGVETGGQSGFGAVVDKVVPVVDRSTATGNLSVSTDKSIPVSAVGRPTEIAQTELSVTPNTKPGAVPVRTDAGAVVGNTSGNGASSLGAADTSRYARQPVASSTDGAVPVVKVAQVESQSPVVAPGTSASDKPVKASGVETGGQSGFGAVVDKVVPVVDRPTATGNLSVSTDKSVPVSAVVRPTEIAQTELSVTPNTKPGAAPVRTDAGAVVGNTSVIGASSLGAADTSRYARQPVASSTDGVVPVVKVAQVESQSPVVAPGTSASDKPVKASGVESAAQSGFGAMVDKVVPVGDRPTATGNLGVATDKNSPVSAVVKPTEIAQTELLLTPNTKTGATPVRTDAGAVVGNTSVTGASSLGAADTSRYARQPVASSTDGVVPVVKVAQVESQSQSPVVAPGTSASDKPVKASGVESAAQSGFGAMVDKVVPVGDRPTATGNLGVATDKNSPVSAVVKPTEIAQTELLVTPNTKTGATPVRTDAGAVVGNTSGNGASSLGAADTSRYARQPVVSSTDGVVPVVKVAQVESQSPVVVSGTSASDKPVKASGVESASQSGFGAMVDKVVPVGDRPTATGNLGVATDKNSPVSAVVRPTEIMSANNSATSTVAQSTVGKSDAGVVAGNAPIGLAAKLGSVLGSDLTNPAIKTGAANVSNVTNRADVDTIGAGVAPAVVPVRADANVKVPVAASGVDGSNVSLGTRPALASDTTGGVVSARPVAPTPSTVIAANVPASRAAEAGAASVSAKSDERAMEMAAVAAASVVAGKKGMAGEGTIKTETVVGKGSFVPTKVEPINGAVVGKLDAAGKVELGGKNDVGATPATSSLIAGKAPFTSVKGHVAEDKSEPESLSGKKLDSNETLTGKAEPVKGSVPGIKTTDTGAFGTSVKVKGEADKADDEADQADFVEETSSALGIFNPALGGPGSLLGVNGSLAGALNDPSQSGGTAANIDPDNDPAASEPPALNTSATLVPQIGAGDVGTASNRIDYALPDLEIVSDGCGEEQRQDSAAMSESLAEASSKDDSEPVRLNDCDSLIMADAKTRLDTAEGARQRRPNGLTAAEMQQALEEERRRRAQQRTRADKETAKTGKGGRKPQAPAKDDLEKRRKHRIGETDTLESISEQILGHSGLAELIYIINRGFFRESRGSERGVLCLEFVAGTVIFLPTDLEIQEYLGRVRKNSALRFEYQRTSSSVSLRQIVAQNCTRPMARAKAPTTFKVVAKGNSQAFAARNRAVRIDDVDRMLVSDPTQQLAAFEEISRVVTSAEDEERYFARIEVINGEHWSTVVEYTIEADGGVMLVHSKSGNVRTIPVDLPVEMLKAMAVTDLSKNRLAYSRKFMQGRKIFA